MKITQFFLTRKDFQIQKEGNPEIVLKNCHILLKKVVFLFFFFLHLRVHSKRYLIIYEQFI